MKVRTVSASLGVLAFVTSLSTSPALSQTFPKGDEDGLISYGDWEASKEYLQASVRTDSEGGWAQLNVMRTSSVGGAFDSLSFDFGTAIYEPGYVKYFAKLLDKDLGKAVSLSVDGQRFTAATAVYGRGEDGNSLTIEMSFTPMAEDDGVLQPSEPNCQVIQALMNAHEISVQFRGFNGKPEDSLTMTGKGSSAALRDLAC